MHGEQLEQRLLVGVQQVVAPLDERRQRHPGLVRHRLAVEQPKAALDQGEELA